MKTLVALTAGVTISLFVAAPALAQTTDDRDGFPWWGWLLVALILAAAFLAFAHWGRRTSTPSAPAASKPSSSADAPSGDTIGQAVQTFAGTGEPDDLTRIEGIGPKISSVLGDAGIASFAGLAQADVTHLRTLLDTPNLRIADPTSWPEQAALAANDEWDELEELQDRLSAGRAKG